MLHLEVHLMFGVLRSMLNSEVHLMFNVLMLPTLFFMLDAKKCWGKERKMKKKKKHKEKNEKKKKRKCRGKKKE